MDFLQNEIVLGVLVFTIAVNMMVFVILGARKLLVSSGNVSISMNDAAKSVDASTPLGKAALDIFSKFCEDGDSETDYSGISKTVSYTHLTLPTTPYV